MNRSSLSATFVAFLAVFAGAQAILAQARPGAGDARIMRLPVGLDDALQPDFIRRDLVHFDRGLALDVDQRLIVQTLFGDYEAAFKQGSDKVRARLAEAQPGRRSLDPDDERQREALRERLMELMEQVQQAREAGDAEKAQALVEQLEQEGRAIEQELRALQPQRPTPEQTRQGWEKAGEEVATWNVERARLREEFISNVQALLSEDQLTRWPALERKLLREKTLGRGRISGESVDLFVIVQQMNPALSEQSMQAIEPRLEEYSIDLDAALRRRNEQLASAQRELLGVMQGGDPQGAQPLLERSMQVRVAVRDVNERYAQIIAAQLQEQDPPTQSAEAFTSAYRARAYPRIFRSTQTQRLFAAAKALDDLDPAARQSVIDLEKAYLDELAISNERLLEVMRTQEPRVQIERARSRITSFSAREANQAQPAGESVEGGRAPRFDPADDPIQEAFAKRNDMGRGYNRQLEALLTPEQLQRLPQISDDPEAGEQGAGLQMRRGGENGRERPFSGARRR